MPSLAHEALIELFRNRPSLAAELLHEALGVELPEHSDTRTESSELTDVLPATYRADLVVALMCNDAPVFGIIVEVQLRPDEDKRYSWPAYLVLLRARLRCPTALLVVAPDNATAKWCSRSIVLGPGGSVTPLVLGANAVPIVVEPERAEQAPELAVLSALAHCGAGDDQALRVAMAALNASVGLPSDLAMLYYDLILASLSDAAREALREMMETQGYEFQSEFARKYYGRGREEGR